MSELTTINEWTKEQLDLIKSTVAKNATDDELKLFLYRCKNMDLDPLKPGQIYFVKYGTSPGTIVVGIDGFRVQASKSGKHTGTKRGVLRNNEGKCLGAWCEVFRSDWTEPAREEVSLAEYDTGKAMWAKMPETMIKKVAEAAALRMAFPDQLGGMYTAEEMQQAEVEAKKPQERPLNLNIKAIAQKLDRDDSFLPPFEGEEEIQPPIEPELVNYAPPGPGKTETQRHQLAKPHLDSLKKKLTENNIPWVNVKKFVKNKFNIEDPMLMTFNEMAILTNEIAKTGLK